MRELNQQEKDNLEKINSGLKDVVNGVKTLISIDCIRDYDAEDLMSHMRYIQRIAFTKAHIIKSGRNT